MKNQLFCLLLLISQVATFTAAAKDVLEWDPHQEKATVANNDVAVVKGHGKALPEGVRVRLIKWEDGHSDFVATDTIANGQFRLELPVKEGFAICSLIFDYYAFPSMIHKLYLTPGAVVELDAVDNYMYTWPMKSNVPEQAEYELYVDNSKDLWTEYQVADIKYDKSRDRAAFEKCDSLKRLIYLRDIELLKTRPVGTTWIDKAKDIAMMSHRLKIYPEDLKSMYANLDDSIKNSPKGRAIYGYLYPGSPIKIGDKFPDTEFHDIDGNKHRFSEFQGKWCLVDFWNSGCSPCLRALPELRELKNTYPDTLELVSLSLDAEHIWRKASEKLPLLGNNWNEGKEDYGIFRRLDTNAYPTFLIVAPDCTIKDLWIGYHTGELKEKMNLYLSPEGKIEYNEQ